MAGEEPKAVDSAMTAPEELPITVMRSGSIRYSAAWALNQRTDACMSSVASCSDPSSR